MKLLIVLACAIVFATSAFSQQITAYVGKINDHVFFATYHVKSDCVLAPRTTERITSVDHLLKMQSTWNCPECNPLPSQKKLNEASKVTFVPSARIPGTPKLREGMSVEQVESMVGEGTQTMHWEQMDIYRYENEQVRLQVTYEGGRVKSWMMFAK